MYPPKAYAEKDIAVHLEEPDRHRALQVRPLVARTRRSWSRPMAEYWRGAPKIKTVVFRPIPDDAVRVAALQNGEIDVAVNIPPHLAAVIDKHPKVFLSTAPRIRTIQLMFYTHQMDAQHKVAGAVPGLTADKRVRQAIASAIDADEIIKDVLDGKGVRIATMLTSMHFGFDPALKPIKLDLARTKKLLAEAGFPNGVELVLNGPQGRYVRDKEVAEAVTGQLNKAGIRTTLQHLRVRQLPEHHGLRPQGRAGVAHRLGHADHRRRDHLPAALPRRAATS